MNTMVVDDWHLAATHLIQILTAIDPDGQHHMCTSALQTLSYLEEHDIDVAFLDIEMPEMNGLELAKRIKELRPHINIIFVTGYPQYALAAHGLYVTGFLIKPANEETVLEALNHLRFPICENHKRLRVQCFGNFELFVDNKPLTFKRSKTKELVAYLIDRKGANCTMGELVSVLWEDKPDSLSQHNQLRNLITDLRQTLRERSLEHIIIKGWNCLAIDISQIDCDYYGFLRSDPVCVNAYTGEYMSQYSWAEMTTGFLFTAEK